MFTGPDDGTFFEEGDSSFCCPGGGGDSVEDGLPDGPLWDVGNLGDCTGEVAEMTSQCVECDGPAYALCNGVFYSTCSCDLPPGYVLVRGGDGDGGSKDAAAETAPTDATTNESETKDATDATTKDGGGEGGG